MHSFILCFLCLAAVLVPCYCQASHQISLTSFMGKATCGLESRVAMACAEPRPDITRGLLECVSKCTEVTSCLGGSQDNREQCYHHYPCPQSVTCSPGDDHFKLYRKSGENTGHTIKNGDFDVTLSSEDSTISTSSPASQGVVEDVNSPAGIPTTASTAKATSTTLSSMTTTSTTLSSMTTTSTTTTEQPCRNNGTRDLATKTCVCVNGWVGDYCERIPTSCTELTKFGYSKGWPGHWVHIQPAQLATPFLILCELGNSDSKSFLMSNNGWQNHTRSWDDYVNGYYLDNDNFWVGLAKIKALNNLRLRILYLETSFNHLNKTSLFEYSYHKFLLAGAAKSYTLSYDSAWRRQTGPYGSQLQYADCLQPLKGARFSTWDHDNDDVAGRNCAAETGVGWWYHSCSVMCNPLGFNYQRDPQPNSTQMNFKMEGLDLANDEYARDVRISMYLQD